MLMFQVLHLLIFHCFTIQPLSQSWLFWCLAA